MEYTVYVIIGVIALGAIVYFLWQLCRGYNDPNRTISALPSSPAADDSDDDFICLHLRGAGTIASSGGVTVRVGRKQTSKDVLPE